MATDTTFLNDSKPLVLCVDDSQDVQRLLRARLKHEELELLPCLTGTDAVRLALDRLPALVLLDLDLPGIDGFEVLRMLKDNPATSQMPVIVISGLQSPQDKVTAFDLGAIDYITKPFELTELRVRVRSALRMHQLVQMLAQKAQIDGLTGLWNRAFFEKRLAEEHSRNDRSDRPLSIAMIDADHFKSINDTYGHPAGDAVLTGLARVIQRESRQSDVVCRYGGEEFVMLMPDTAPTDAHSVCDRIRQTLAGITWPRHPDRHVTVSIGVAGSARSTRLTPQQWVEAADKNLYAAKQGGRNRVVMSDLLGCAPVAKAG